MKDLESDLSMFVDIMYYDYILYKLVELYNKPVLITNIDDEDYFGIAKKLHKKFKDKDITLDNEIALKILFIRFKRIYTSNTCKGRANPSCCVNHTQLLLTKAFECILEMKQDYSTIKDNQTFRDLNVLIASLVFIVSQGDTKRNQMVKEAYEYLKTHNIEINNSVDFMRLKKSMYIRLGVSNDVGIGEKLIKSIDSMLEKISKLFKEPFLYTLSVEKVTNILRKHDPLFKNEKEILKVNKKDIFEPETPGETIKWEEKWFYLKFWLEIVQ